MYDWQTNPRLCQTFREGQFVTLNPEWLMYDYLKREFGHMFPRGIHSISGDIVRIPTSKGNVPFAAQCLTAIR